MGMETSSAPLAMEVGRVMVKNAPLVMEQGKKPVGIVVGMGSRPVLCAAGR
jgi:hypothetical protein